MNDRITDWAGKRVWVIGASTGIGRALAGELARRGARVAVSARSAGKLASLAEGFEHMRVLPLDITEPGAAARAARELVSDWGGIDVVAPVAGIYRPVRAWELTPESIRGMVATNLTGVMEATAAAVPAMLAQGRGTIVIFSSVAGYRGLPKALVYGPTKAALINFAETLHLDLQPKGISVHLVCPGFVATPATARNDFRMPALISADEAAREILKGIGRGRFEIHFPRRFTLWMKLLGLMPHWLYSRAVARVTGL